MKLLRPKSRRAGNAVLEMAFVFAPFCILMLGIMDFSQFLFHQQVLVERVRAAARWGALHSPTDTDAIVNVALYSQPTIPTDGRPPGFGLTRQMVSVSALDAGTDAYRLQVQLSGYSYLVLSPFIAGRYMGRPVTVTMPLGLDR